MTARLMTKRVLIYRFLSFLLVSILMLSTVTPVKASENVLDEVRYLLKTEYVEPVSDEVLNAPTVEEMLERLGDQHTKYFTPEQYQDFVGSIDMSFVGIGIHMEMLPEGVKVIGIISGSPAEDVGLKPGDVILKADGQSLAGLTSEEAVTMLRGLEGSTVQLTVKQGTETRILRVTRGAISEPTVTGEVLNGHIGYLDLNTFGESTPEEFETLVRQLKEQSVDSWIVDLRNNGGGYLSSALELASYFIGPDVAVCIKDRTGTLYPYNVKDPGWRMDQRIIVLINENSASASEILAAAVKDHEKATLVGTTTFGKGTVQSMFFLENGGVLKMTVDHFYSPRGQAIDKVGVSPNVMIQDTDSLKAAELMLADPTEAKAMARRDAYWEAWSELSGLAGESSADPSLNYLHYYSDYQKVAELTEVSLYKKFTVEFSGEVDWQSVNNTSIELINSNTGERTLTSFEPLGPSRVQVIPETALIPDTTYWLVIHPTILGVAGQTLQEGGVAVAHTMKGEEVSAVTSRIQSVRVKDQAREGYTIDPRNPGYGSAINDLRTK